MAQLDLQHLEFLQTVLARGGVIRGAAEEGLIEVYVDVKRALDRAVEEAKAEEAKLHGESPTVPTETPPAQPATPEATPTVTATPETTPEVATPPETAQQPTQPVATSIPMSDSQPLA